MKLVYRLSSIVAMCKTALHLYTFTPTAYTQ